MLEKLGDEGGRRLRSCGGPGAGSAMSELPQNKGDILLDWEFAAAFRWRLGLGKPPPGATCKKVSAKHNEECDKPLGECWMHAVTCKWGPSINFVHGSLAKKLCEFGKEAGGIVRREVVIPEFQREGTNGPEDAIADVTIHGTAAAYEMLLDVTIRHPGAGRYTEAGIKDGVAAKKAEEEKKTKYPPRGGREMIPMAIEAYGRWGEIGLQTLRALAGAANDEVEMRGGERDAQATMRRWLAETDLALIRGMARAIREATEGPEGRDEFGRLGKKSAERECQITHQGFGGDCAHEAPAETAAREKEAEEENRAQAERRREGERQEKQREAEKDQPWDERWKAATQREDGNEEEEEAGRPGALREGPEAEETGGHEASCGETWCEAICKESDAICGAAESAETEAEKPTQELNSQERWVRRKTDAIIECAKAAITSSPSLSSTSTTWAAKARKEAGKAMREAAALADELMKPR